MSPNIARTGPRFQWTEQFSANSFPIPRHNSFNRIPPFRTISPSWFDQSRAEREPVQKLELLGQKWSLAWTKNICFQLLCCMLFNFGRYQKRLHKIRPKREGGTPHSINFWGQTNPSLSFRASVEAPLCGWFDQWVVHWSEKIFWVELFSCYSHQRPSTWNFLF